jgi:hypothetical protein
VYTLAYSVTHRYLQTLYVEAHMSKPFGRRQPSDMYTLMHRRISSEMPEKSAASRMNIRLEAWFFLLRQQSQIRPEILVLMRMHIVNGRLRPFIASTSLKSMTSLTD